AELFRIVARDITCSVPLIGIPARRRWLVIQPFARGGRCITEVPEIFPPDSRRNSWPCQQNSDRQREGRRSSLPPAHWILLQNSVRDLIIQKRLNRNEGSMPAFYKIEKHILMPGSKHPTADQLPVDSICERYE